MKTLIRLALLSAVIVTQTVVSAPVKSNLFGPVPQRVGGIYGPIDVPPMPMPYIEPPMVVLPTPEPAPIDKMISFLKLDPEAGELIKAMISDPNVKQVVKTLVSDPNNVLVLTELWSTWSNHVEPIIPGLANKLALPILKLAMIVNEAGSNEQVFVQKYNEWRAALADVATIFADNRENIVKIATQLNNSPAIKTLLTKHFAKIGATPAIVEIISAAIAKILNNSPAITALIIKYVNEYLRPIPAAV